MAWMARGIAPHSQGGVQGDGARGDDVDLLHVVVSQLHDGAFAKVLLYLVHGSLQGLELLRVRPGKQCCHNLFRCYFNL